MSKPYPYQRVPIEDVDRVIKEEYTGCCICHVRKGAKIVGILGLILDIIFVAIVTTNIIARQMVNEPISTWDGVTLGFVMVLSLLGVLVHGLILYGLKKENHKAFLPYLIIKPIEICGHLGAILGVGTEIVNSITTTTFSGDNQTPDISSLFMALVVKIWFWCIIFKAYIYFKKQQNS